MANIYAVSYDLRSDGADYTGLYEVLKSSTHWWHYLESTWLVVVDEDVDELRIKLKPHVKKGDRLLIISVGPESEGWLPEKAWNWIKRNIDTVASQTH